VWLSFGGRPVRVWSTSIKFQWGASHPSSPMHTLSRLRLSADLHVTPYFRMYVEGKKRAGAGQPKAPGGHIPLLRSKLAL